MLVPRFPLPVLHAGRALSLLFCFFAPGAATRAAPVEAEARITTWLKAWDAQPIHRTGTAGDEAGASWLAREAEAIAGKVDSESFPLDRIDPTAVFLEFDGERIPGEMLFDGLTTGPDGIRGAAGKQGSDAPIAVLPVPPSIVYGAEFRQMRRESRVQAHVIITQGGAPGLAPLNAELFRAPFGPPAIQVASGEHDRIMAALARRTEFRVVVQAKRTPAQARNIIVTIPGRDRSRPPIVVMTPRSSWWVSTSERCGGLACWLEVLRAVKAAPPPARDVIFTANSGHEIGHIGLDDFVARRPGCEKAFTWVHFGASIGATGSKLVIQSNQDDLRALIVKTLAAAGQKPDSLADKAQVPTGETRDIHRAGGRYLTIGAPPASNALFHLPQDRWPDAVDVPAIARIAAGTAHAVVELARQP